MGWFDNLIGWFSPKAACEREAWRLQLQQLRGAGYDAADHGRLNANWQAYNESADLTDRVARDTIRARARDLERNSDLANEIILAFRRNVVGKGFTLQARTQSDELNSQVEALWRQWTKSRNCDVTGQQSLNQMLRMAVQRKKVDGGILFLKCYTKDGLLPFKLQALEVDELALSQSVPKYKDDRVVGGVEFNRYGKPTGYCTAVQHRRLADYRAGVPPRKGCNFLLQQAATQPTAGSQRLCTDHQPDPRRERIYHGGERERANRRLPGGFYPQDGADDRLRTEWTDRRRTENHL